MHRLVIVFLIYVSAFLATAAGIKSLGLPTIALIAISAGLLAIDCTLASLGKAGVVSWVVNGVAYATLYICLTAITQSMLVVFMGVITMPLARSVVAREEAK